MAKQTTVTITDDLDGSGNAKEVSFSLNGRSWVIDLNAKNRAALEKALKPYISKATEQRGSGRRGKAVEPAVVAAHDGFEGRRVSGHHAAHERRIVGFG